MTKIFRYPKHIWFYDRFDTQTTTENPVLDTQKHSRN